MTASRQLSGRGDVGGSPDRKPEENGVSGAEEREREQRLCSRSAAGARQTRTGIQSGTWRLCPNPHRNEIVRGSCGLTRAAARARGVSGALQDRWSLRELFGAEIPLNSATRSVRGGGGGRTTTAVKTSPHPTPSPNPAGKCERPDRARIHRDRRLRTGGRRPWFGSRSLASCMGSGLSLSLSSSLSL